MLIAKAKRKVKNKREIQTVDCQFAMFSMNRKEDLLQISLKIIKMIKDNLKLKKSRFLFKIPGIQNNHI